MIMKNKYLILTLFLIFVISVFIRYIPIYSKGYAYWFSSESLVLAKNLHLIGKYSTETENNIVLSSALIDKSGVNSDKSNKLTSLLYGKIFDIFGFNTNLPLYVSLLIYGITTVLLFIIISRIFNFKIALIFALIDIFIPFILAGSISFGFYEWALLFFTFGLFIYLRKENPGLLRLFLSGLFFGLAVLSRDAFLISFGIIVIYDIYKKFTYKNLNWKKIKTWFFPFALRTFIFVLPVLIIFGGYMVRDYIGGTPNYYLNYDYSGYDSHLFPDPYTYQFERFEYINGVRDNVNGETVVFLKRYNYEISLKQRISIYTYSIKYYIVNLLHQSNLGGPLILFFVIMGLIYTFKFKKNIFIFSTLWICLLLFVLVLMGTSNWDHLLEARFPIILLISTGFFWALTKLKEIVPEKNGYILLAGIILVLVLHLCQSDKWMLHENYLYSGAENRIKILKNITETNEKIDKIKDIVAISDDPFFFNYYTDNNYIYFNLDTVKKLLEQNKLKWAFGKFNVTAIAGYGELSDDIKKDIGVKIISP